MCSFYSRLNGYRQFNGCRLSISLGLGLDCRSKCEGCFSLYFTSLLLDKFSLFDKRGHKILKLALYIHTYNVHSAILRIWLTHMAVGLRCYVKDGRP